MEVKEIHEKIINFLRLRGPGLPIQIAKQIGISSLFVSAFLSELADGKRIKISCLKVGGSPLYFLDGQEEKLENFYSYMHPKEIESFQLLKENKILKDSEQEPAVRVALREIKDFAIAFNFNNEIYWRYFSSPVSEIEELLRVRKHVVREVSVVKEIPAAKQALIVKSAVLTEQISKPIISVKPEYMKKDKIKVHKTKSIKPISITQEVKSKTKLILQNDEFKNPLIITKTKKQRPKSDFVLKVIDFINMSKWQIIEEKDYKLKEYNCILQIKSELGAINFLVQAKDKKTISEYDLKKLLSNSQSIPLPALILYNGELGKKSLNFLNEYSSILKAKKIE